jgi:hypothetical protein
MDDLMSMKLNLILILSLLYCPYSFSREYVAKVVKLRGNATQLIPGKHNASKLKLGDQLTEDTSVVTSSKSFVRIQFFDGSNISLGPNGKVVVSKMNKSGKGILTLLKGQLRSKINSVQTKSKGHKFLIKTRSAALGVRGTEFQTIYNPENNITNLLTFKGEVAIAKVETKRSQKDVYENKISKISKKQISKSQSIRLKKDLNSEMETALSSKDAIVVKRGQFSGALDSVDRATLPVNISTGQLNALYQNKDLNESSKNKVKLSKLSKEASNKDFLNPIISDSPPEGIYYPNNGDFAQKSGGFIDVKTGIYVPPERTSSFSQTKKIYLAQKVGNYDVNTGQYHAPKGLALNSTKGFVVSSNQKNIKSKKNQAKIMNSIIDKKVVLKKKVRKKRVRFYNQLELFAKNAVSIRVAGAGSTIKHYDSPQVPARNIKSDGKEFKLTWDHSSGGKWQPITNISYRRIRFDGNDLGVFNQSTASLYGMELGVRRYINSRVNISSSMGLNQNFFTASSTDNGTTTYDIRKATVPILDISGQWFYAKSLRYDFDLRFGLTYSLSKTAKDVEFGSGLGAKFGTGFRYWIKKNWWSRVDFNGSSSKHEITGTNYSANNEIINTSLGIEFGYVI